MEAVYLVCGARRPQLKRNPLGGGTRGFVIMEGAATTFGLAWLIATIALALHVVDEATHDFLSWYNPRALGIRQALGGLPFPPTFTFLPWVLGLSVAVLILASLTPAAYAGSAWIRPFGYALAAIHIANGLLHLVGSILARRLVPGVLSAPFLMISGAWLLYETSRV
jgi:uncharacterized protein with HXXEE motif